jgi:hypothetical protein
VNGPTNKSSSHGQKQKRRTFPRTKAISKARFPPGSYRANVLTSIDTHMQTLKRTFPLKSTEAARKYIEFLLSQGYEFHVKCFTTGRVDVTPLPPYGRELPAADFPPARLICQ